MNVDEYLERIDYSGPREPNLETLKALTFAQKLAVPYTTLAMYGGPPISLDKEKIYKKIVTEKGGGVCYEINSLFVWLIQQLGFEAYFCPGEFHHGFYNGFSWDHHHLIPIVIVDGAKYVVDPGWVLFGPMKLEHMLSYSETHGMYRFREIPDREGWYYMERHKKTVLDCEGRVLKQGPGTDVDGYCNEECRKEDSSHWAYEFQFDSTPSKLEDFQYRCEYLQTSDNSLLLKNACMIRYKPNKCSMLFGDAFSCKENVNPKTDKILKEMKITNDDELVKLAKEHFYFNVNHNLNFFSQYW